MQAGYCSTFRALAGYNAFTAEHVPHRAQGAVLICAPFLEERLFCRPVLRNLADALMDAGWHTMRMDPPGEGDSEGDLCEVGLDDALAQIQQAATLLRERVKGPLVLVGLRWGASLALASARGTEAERVIAVEPLLSGEDYLQQLLRQNLTTQMATWGRVRENREALLDQSKRGEVVNVQGFELGPRLIRDMRKFRVRQADDAARALLVRCAPDGSPPPSWQAWLGHDQVEFAAVPVRPFWFDPRHYDPFQAPLRDMILTRMQEWYS